MSDNFMVWPETVVLSKDEFNEMIEALRPFAEVADDFDADGRELADTDGIYANTAGDFRRARSILANKGT